MFKLDVRNIYDQSYGLEAYWFKMYNKHRRPGFQTYSPGLSCTSLGYLDIPIDYQVLCF